jgi:hypothetical protein
MLQLRRSTEGSRICGVSRSLPHPSVYVQTTQTTAASTPFSDLTAGNIEVQVIGTAGPSNFSNVGGLMAV